MSIRTQTAFPENGYSDREKKGVCFFVGKLFALSGLASQTKLLARELAGAGFSVFLITYPPQEPSPPCEISPCGLDRLPPQVEIIRIERTESSFADAIGQIRHRFSVFIFQGVPLAHKVRVVKSYGKKVLMRMTGYRFGDIKDHPHYKDLFPLLSSVDRFISLSPPLSRSFAECGLDSSRLVMIPNMVDAEYFSPVTPGEKKALRQALSLPADACLVTFVGSIKAEKGLDILLRAWELVRARNKGAYLLLLGPLCSTCGGYDRPCEEKGAAAARVERTLGVLTGKLAGLMQQQERIIFAGAHEDIRDYLRSSDIFFFPSRREGMPNSVMEAMASSLACVTSAIEEITADLVPDERFGLAVAGEDLYGYARAVLKLAADADLRKRMGRQARRRMKEKFSPSIARAKYCDLITSLLTDN